MSDLINHVLLYNPATSFNFIQLGFWLFLIIVLFTNSLVYKKVLLRNTVLLLLNLFFYYKAGGLTILLLITFTLFSYLGGVTLGRIKKRLLRIFLVSMLLALVLSVLLFFKYASFLQQLIFEYTHLKINILQTFQTNWQQLIKQGLFIIPIGISFYTFQTISYLADVYSNKIEPIRNPVDFAFYLTFFPNIVSGPILRASEFTVQLRNKVSITEREMWSALLLIGGGLLKKMVLGDYLATNLVDRIIASPESFTGFEILLGTLGYTLRIYADFSGYTDIAIGVALLIGFKLPLNFNSPYKAQSVTEFWKRWHITLSRWLRDYVYIPLGGNKRGVVRQSINLLITMLLGGLWHGASLSFLIWGLLHGIALIVNKIYTRAQELFNFNSPKWFNWAITFVFISLSWLFFAAPDFDTAMILLSRMVTTFNISTLPSVIDGYYTAILLIISGFTLHFLPQKIKNDVKERFLNLHYIFKVIGIVVIILIVLSLKNTSVQPFIYVNF